MGLQLLQPDGGFRVARHTPGQCGRILCRSDVSRRQVAEPDAGGASAVASRLVRKMRDQRASPSTHRTSWEATMPERETIERAREDAREGKAPTTQAGEFVREEIHHVREGKHGARSPEQAIAIGLSKARRAGVRVPTPRRGTTSEATREAAKRDARQGRSGSHPTSTPPSRATLQALRHQGPPAGSPRAIA